ncbi:hypothetical protein TR13x_09210 [Caloranaerobacter sp. TR13]|uniref:hypothetical protein n=1 Tax=Caloranaerobacter sp. TR13 TaxID=1302151 RepID=UPI0006D3EF70|nr:hypothetical protein [Caloranaerobacter sp. TR13]KPU26660.1 hypothetical protein TR13x_09210 [Caloranaerobacter sp. TR13]
MHRIFLNEQDFYTKLEDVISEHKCLRLKQDGNEFEIMTVRMLGFTKNILLHPILSYADSCKLKTEKTSEGVVISFSLSFIRLKIFYFILGMILSTIFLTFNKSFVAPLVLVGILFINYVVIRNKSIRTFEQFLLNKFM